MAEPKELVASAIARAQADLTEALSQLEKIPALDPGSVAFVAHALNNYLAVAGGTVDLIVMHLGENVDSQVRVWLDGVRHATDLMTRTVSQLVNGSAPDAVRLRIEEFDLARLVRRVCAYYQPMADRKTIRMIADPPVNGALVMADRVVVAAVLDNLLSNAIKYSQPGTEINVQVSGDTDWVVCEVSDQGPGLSPADQARLFQRGARLTPQPTAGESSAGYGLAVAKELVDRLGGSIWCESVVGRGSRFRFRLPATEKPAAS
jgi:signal transduction histidine kinase